MGESGMGGLSASDAIALSRDNNDFMESSMESCVDCGMDPL